MTSPTRRCQYFSVVIVTVPLWLGCREADQIRTYRVPPVAKIEGVADSSAARPKRTLAAIFPQADKVWFFKAMGPADSVAKHKASFDAIVQSVEFSEGTPRWKLPTGWTERAGSDMRFATLSPAPPSTLELTVTQLPAATYNEADNINRWRNQLELPPLAAEELDAHVTRTTVGGVPVVSVDLSARSDASEKLTQPAEVAPSAELDPYATPGSPPLPLANESSAEKGKYGAESSTVASGVPAHWVSGKMSAMRRATYNIQDGDQKAEVTVIVLGAKSGSILENVNRWRGQLGLAPQTNEKLEPLLQNVQTGEYSGKLIEILPHIAEDATNENPPVDASSQAMIAAIVNTATETYYFKLMGSSRLAHRERDNFRQYVEQFKID